MDVKGTAVVSIPEFIQSRFPSRMEEWLDALSAGARAIVSKKILASSWYPLSDAVLEPTQKLCDLFYDGQDKGAWEAGRFSADHGLQGVYKVFVKVATPQFLISRAGRIFSSYYRPSSIEIDEVGAGAVIMRIVEFPEPDRLIEARIGGWVERALEICGCRNLEITTPRSMTAGESVTEIKAQWE